MLKRSFALQLQACQAAWLQCCVRRRGCVAQRGSEGRLSSVCEFPRPQRISGHVARHQDFRAVDFVKHVLPFEKALCQFGKWQGEKRVQFGGVLKTAFRIASHYGSARAHIRAIRAGGRCGIRPWVRGTLFWVISSSCGEKRNQLRAMVAKLLRIYASYHFGSSPWTAFLSRFSIRVMGVGAAGDLFAQRPGGPKLFGRFGR